ncbi:MAG: hypothetical protein ACYC4U_32640 [Pirellulaceae bacterium]
MKERKERRQADGKAGDSRGTTQSDRLRGARNWVLDDKIFADLRLHGNTKWRPKYLVTKNESDSFPSQHAHQTVVGVRFLARE